MFSEEIEQRNTTSVCSKLQSNTKSAKENLWDNWKDKLYSLNNCKTCIFCLIQLQNGCAITMTYDKIFDFCIYTCIWGTPRHCRPFFNSTSPPDKVHVFKFFFQRFAFILFFVGLSSFSLLGLILVLLLWYRLSRHYQSISICILCVYSSAKVFLHVEGA